LKRTALRASEYFKIEAYKVVLKVVVLAVLAYIYIANGASIEIVWNVIALVAVSEFITVFISWMVSGGK